MTGNFSLVWQFYRIIPHENRKALLSLLSLWLGFDRDSLQYKVMVNTHVRKRELEVFRGGFLVVPPDRVDH